MDTLTLDELQKEADLKELSLNVLVNQVLRRYVEWDRYESKLGMMPVPKLMLATLIDETVQVAVDAGISGIDSSRDRLLKKVSGITSDHTIETERRHVFIIQHELGENWSFFAKELLSLIFTRLAELNADITTTPNVLKAEVIL